MSQPPYGSPTGQPQDPYQGQQPPQAPPAGQPYPGQQPYAQQPYGQAPYQPQTPYPGQQPYPGQVPYGYAPVDPTAKSKLAAGLLGIFLGSLGIHRFYLGYTGIGVLMLLLTVLSVGILSPLVAIWGLVEGILYLTATQGSYAVDAQGRPLRA